MTLKYSHTFLAVCLGAGAVLSTVSGALGPCAFLPVSSTPTPIPDNTPTPMRSTPIQTINPTAIPPSGGSSAPHLIFSTYLGGTKPCDTHGTSTHTFAKNAASDEQGNTYVTGATRASDLPFINAWQKEPAKDSSMSAFVAKYDPAGQLLWGTYLGGNHESMGLGIAVMPGGGAAVSGLTTSNSTVPFPTVNPYQPDYKGQSDFFVTVLDDNGTVRYSTYLGGSDMEGVPPGTYSDENNNGNNIAADAQGLVYVTGDTSSGGSGGAKFPVTANARQPDMAGPSDAFLVILDPGKSGPASLVYASFLGGKKNEIGHAVAVNTSGSILTVGGYTDSDDFPTTDNAYRKKSPPPGFTSNGFLAQFTCNRPGDPTATYTPRYSTYLGANSSEARDDVYGMVVDAGGLIIATARTQSPDFPMCGPPAPSIYNSAPYLKPGKSGDEPYLVKVNPALTGTDSLVYSTFLGGGAAAGGAGGYGTCAGVNAAGATFVGGQINSPGVLYIPSGVPTEAPQSFPYTANALYPAPQGGDDGLFMQLSPGGAILTYSTYLGGTLADRTHGLGVDAAGHVVMAGITYSADFPVRNPAQPWPGNTGNANAFITKFAVGQ